MSFGSDCTRMRPSTSAGWLLIWIPFLPDSWSARLFCSASKMCDYWPWQVLTFVRAREKKKKFSLGNPGFSLPLRAALAATSKLYDSVDDALHRLVQVSNQRGSDLEALGRLAGLVDRLEKVCAGRMEMKDLVTASHMWLFNPETGSVLSTYWLFLSHVSL